MTAKRIFLRAKQFLECSLGEEDIPFTLELEKQEDQRLRVSQFIQGVNL